MTRRFRVLSSVALVGGVFSLLLGVRPPTPAAAVGVTCGVPYNVPCKIPPSPYSVPGKIVAGYCGHYTLQSIDRRTRLNDGTVYIEQRTPSSMLGLVQLYGWDQQGHQTSWFAVLTNFHLLAHGRMAIDLYDQAGQYLGDQLLVTRTTAGDLVGQFHLDGKSYAIRWHKLGTH